ncbi:hypothetical protein [Fimbriimonas ginsengisoli]|uniref:Uncharacterized protein n=1 Tax=Fimbriimonas ginsengisoli Gsoil 348 TaxID=661478 RepID=A0A068NSI6_FIMGI|nr:hypothetical protein [Fimbriimonas ginsengisoli]AIE86406.1 hypothetical protein OP10G_3038 [Fimbriimonas ginsengisoli Gsoil 348]
MPLTRVDLSREGWLFVSFDGNRLILSSGINGADRIRAIPIPEKALQRTWTGGALRSYGLAVLISKVHFGPYELDAAS